MVAYLLDYKQQDYYEISAQKINRLCIELRRESIYCDFSAAAFETLAYEYPFNVKVSNCKVEIFRTPNFCRDVLNRIVMFDSPKLRENLWREISTKEY